jgi:hypothetical protein
MSLKTTVGPFLSKIALPSAASMRDGQETPGYEKEEAVWIESCSCISSRIRQQDMLMRILPSRFRLLD